MSIDTEIVFYEAGGPSDRWLSKQIKSYQTEKIMTKRTTGATAGTRKPGVSASLTRM